MLSMLYFTACSTWGAEQAPGLIADSVSDAFGDGDAIVQEGRSLTEAVTLSSVTVQTFDLEAMSKEESCQIAYTLPGGLRGHSGSGIVPGRSFDCADAEATEDARSAAARWVKRTINPSSDPRALSLAIAENVHRLSAEKSALLVKADAWELPFDVSTCISEGTVREVSHNQQAAELQCSLFEEPGETLEEYREQLASRARQAQHRASNTPIRNLPSATASLAEACEADPGAGSLMIPGDTNAVASGLPIVYPIELFAGEELTVYMSAPTFDTYLALFDGACAQQLTSNDDWRNGVSRIRWRAQADMTVAVVARSYRGPTSGPLALTVEVSGRDTITITERDELMAFAAATETLGEENLVRVWQGQASADQQSACLNQAVYAEQSLARAHVAQDVVSACFTSMEEALTIHQEVAAARSPMGQMLSGLGDFLN